MLGRPGSVWVGVVVGSRSSAGRLLKGDPFGGIWMGRVLPNSAAGSGAKAVNVYALLAWSWSGKGKQKQKQNGGELGGTRPIPVPPNGSPLR